MIGALHDAPGRARQRRSIRRGLALGVALAAIVALGGAGGGSAQTAPGSEPTLRLAGQTSWVAPEGNFELELGVAGAPAGAQLQVQVFPPVSSRVRFDESIRGQNLGRPLGNQPPTLPVDSLPTTASGSIRASYPISASSDPPFGVRLTNRGVYPVRVAVLDPDGATVSSLITHLVRVPTDTSQDPPLAVATVVELDAPPSFQPDDQIEMAPMTRDQLRTTVDALDARPDVTLSVAARPETLDALSTLESGTDADTVATLGRAVSGRQLISQTFVSIDLGAWTAVGVDDEDAAYELNSQFTSGPAVVGALLGRLPTPSVWLGDPSLTPLALTRLRFAGVGQLVVPDVQLEPTNPASSTTQLSTFDVLDNEGNPMRAAQIDTALGDRLTSTSDPVLNAHLAMAEMAVLDLDRPADSRGLVWSIPSTTSVHEKTWAALLEGLANHAPSGGAPMISPVTLDDLFRLAAPSEGGGDDGNVPVRQLRTAEPTDLRGLPDEVAATRRRVGSFRTLFEPTGGPAAPLDRQLLVAQSDDIDADTARAHLHGVDASIDEQTAGIITPEAQQVTLTSRSSRIPLTLENQLDVPVDVRIELASDKLEFPDGSTMIATLPPATTTRVEVAVEARASGAFPLDVVVRSPDDGITLGTSRMTVRSTAISGVGLILSIGAGAFLVLWWASHFRKVRRRRQLVSSDHPSVRRGSAI